jgi:hypothetical protein
VTTSREVARKDIEILTKDTEQIVYIWRLWVTLFRSPDLAEQIKRHDLMRFFAPAEPFFATVESALMNEVIHGLYRLLETNRKNALTLRSLEKRRVLLYPLSQKRATAILLEAQRKFKDAKGLRLHFLGHRNRCCVPQFVRHFS